jgi:hypothetical protein
MVRGGGNGEVELSVGARGGGGGAGGLVEPPVPISLGRLVLAGMVAGGVQYGWALQLSLLTPYVQVYTLTRMHPTSYIQLAEYSRVHREGVASCLSVVSVHVLRALPVLLCRRTVHARTVATKTIPRVVFDRVLPF